MKVFFERAIANVTKFGDTDIFPFPIENHIMFDNKSGAVALLLDLYSNFSERLAQYPPANYSALVPINYTGFRWATQIDPLWNAFFLGVVLSIAEEIEAARVPCDRKVIFSYRYKWDEATHALFDQDFQWRSFMEHSLQVAQHKKFVVACDISEFYPRLNHHRLENALKQLRLKGDQPAKIMGFLANYSDTYSFGMPVGGPAARILSELLLNQIDRLLIANGIIFCRFADDYHIFADSYEEAFRALVFLSERLLQNQGLQLQKAKTRIMSGQEFISTSPLQNADDDVESKGSSIRTQSKNLLRFSLRFDPYSPTAIEDYEALRNQIEKFDLLGILKSELTKSRIHVSLSKKIISAIRYIDETQLDDAVTSLIQNPDLLYPIYANILMVIKTLFDDLQLDTQQKIIGHITELIKNESHVLRVDLNLAYAVRVLACQQSPENEELLNRTYAQTRSVLLRRDIILIMAKWRAWYWLSDLKTTFRTLSPAERRAFLIASYFLTDEGKHWREHIGPELSPFENLVKEWAADKMQHFGWSIPL